MRRISTGAQRKAPRQTMRRVSARHRPAPIHPQIDKLPLTPKHAERFLRYADRNPVHHVRLRRTGSGTDAEWMVTPLADPESYSLTFDVPEQVESWISQHEEQRASRARSIKEQFLSDITIYRTIGDNLRTYQLRYEPSEFRRQ
jgi:hypothetical protein